MGQIRKRGKFYQIRYYRNGQRIEETTEFDGHPGDVAAFSSGHPPWAVGRRRLVDWWGASNWQARLAG